MSVTSITATSPITSPAPVCQTTAPSASESPLRPLSRDSFWRSSPLAVGVGTVVGTTAVAIPAGVIGGGILKAIVSSRHGVGAFTALGAGAAVIPAVTSGLVANQVTSTWGGIAAGTGTGAATGIALAIPLALTGKVQWQTGLIVGATVGTLAGAVSSAVTKLIDR